MHISYAISVKFQLPSENVDKRKVNFQQNFFQFSEAGENTYRSEKRSIQ